MVIDHPWPHTRTRGVHAFDRGVLWGRWRIPVRRGPTLGVQDPAVRNSRAGTQGTATPPGGLRLAPVSTQLSHAGLDSFRYRETYG
jgi:hypothetical protein